MLENAGQKELDSLVMRKGTPADFVRIAEIAAGTVIKATMDSGAVYLFEILNPSTALANVVLHFSPVRKHRLGCHGQRTVSPVFHIGGYILYRPIGGNTHSRTSSVRSMQIHLP